MNQIYSKIMWDTCETWRECESRAQGALFYHFFPLSGYWFNCEPFPPPIFRNEGPLDPPDYFPNVGINWSLLCPPFLRSFIKLNSVISGPTPGGLETCAINIWFALQLHASAQPGFPVKNKIGGGGFPSENTNSRNRHCPANYTQMQL